MNSYEGRQLVALRKKLEVPYFLNGPDQYRLLPHPSAREMTALLNYAIKKRGITDQLISLRTYENCESRGYGIWMRLALDSLWEVIIDVLRYSDRYEIITDDINYPVLRKIETLEDKWRNIKLDPECCKVKRRS